MTALDRTATLPRPAAAAPSSASAQVRAGTAGQFQPAGAYLNTATVGLPPAAGWQALQDALEQWRGGTGDPLVWDSAVDRSRVAAARLLGVPSEHVAVGSQLSVFAGLVAASLPAGSVVVAAEEDFTSVLFPFLAQTGRGVQVRLVPLDRLAEAVDADTTLVAVSSVQSVDGRVADLDAVAAAAAHHGSRTFVDVTHSCGWLALDAARFDYVACSAYKWLLSPRGTAFMYVRPERLADVTPHNANWYAGEDVWSSLYGAPLRLAGAARRLDVSPAWFCWVGAAPAMELLDAVGVDAIGAHDIALANRFRAGVGLAAYRSPIVSIPVPDGTEDRLAAAGVQCCTRAGAMRVSFHLYNTEADVDRALDVLDAVGRPADGDDCDQ